MGVIPFRKPLLIFLIEKKFHNEEEEEENEPPELPALLTTKSTRTQREWPHFEKPNNAIKAEKELDFALCRSPFRNTFRL